MFAVAIRAGGVRLVAMIGFWTVTGAIAFGQAFRGVNSFWYFWIPFAFLIAAVVAGPGFRHARRPIPEESGVVGESVGVVGGRRNAPRP